MTCMNSARTSIVDSIRMTIRVYLLPDSLFLYQVELSALFGPALRSNQTDRRDHENLGCGLDRRSEGVLFPSHTARCCVCVHFSPST